MVRCDGKDRGRRSGVIVLVLAAGFGIPVCTHGAAAVPPTPTPTAGAPSDVRPSITPVPTPSPRTVCAEWIRQSHEGYERLTLFADRMLVWKKSRDGKDDVLRKPITAEELVFYCDYFSRNEVWALSADLRTGLSSELSGTSALTLTRADGSRKTIRFDDFSPLPAEAAAVRAALEGLRTMLTSPLAPASRFAPAELAVGQILKRFDGEMFRIRALEKEKGVVEIEGVTQPYRQFLKIDELRFQFSPPE